MARVLTFSRVFPVYHPKKGQPTQFVEKIWKVFLNRSSLLFPYWMKDETISGITIRDCYDYKPKKHTIRAGKRWKAGDVFSARVWSGMPYASKQITIAPDNILSRVADFEITGTTIYINGAYYCNLYSTGIDIETLAGNDGLSVSDFQAWFVLKGKGFSGQILIWEDDIKLY